MCREVDPAHPPQIEGGRVYEMRRTNNKAYPDYELASNDVGFDTPWPFTNVRLRAWIIPPGKKDAGYHIKVESEDPGTVELYHGKWVVLFESNAKSRFARKVYISDFDECYLLPTRPSLDYKNVQEEISDQFNVRFYWYK